MQQWLRMVSGGIEVDVWVVPGASRSGVAGVHHGRLRIRVAAPPEAGKANQAVAALLKRQTGAGRIELVRGATTRRKTFFIAGGDGADVEMRLTRS